MTAGCSHGDSFEKHYKKKNIPTIQLKNIPKADLISTLKASMNLNKSHLKQAWTVRLRSVLMYVSN